ncbi:MAG: hypothetical protein L0Y72_25645 [Gemmataceae bacterium]|nr:hypothetical protein [Gemmataceae bacterium]
MFETKNRLWVVHIADEEPGARRARGRLHLHRLDENRQPCALRHAREDQAAYHKAYPDALSFPSPAGRGVRGEGIRSSYGQVFRFAHEMEIGDPVIYPIKGSRDILIGEITGRYRWADDDRHLVENDYCNVHKVRWQKRLLRIVSKITLRSSLLAVRNSVGLLT